MLLCNVYILNIKINFHNKGLFHTKNKVLERVSYDFQRSYKFDSVHPRTPPGNHKRKQRL